MNSREPRIFDSPGTMNRLFLYEYAYCCTLHTKSQSPALSLMSDFEKDIGRASYAVATGAFDLEPPIYENLNTPQNFPHRRPIVSPVIPRLKVLLFTPASNAKTPHLLARYTAEDIGS